MQLTNRRVGNSVVLAASGRIDHASAEEFKAALQPYLENCRAGGDVVVLDFSAEELFATTVEHGYSSLVSGVAAEKCV